MNNLQRWTGHLVSHDALLNLVNVVVAQGEGCGCYRREYGLPQRILHQGEFPVCDQPAAALTFDLWLTSDLLQGGMGAALLSDPDKIEAVSTSTGRQVCQLSGSNLITNHLFTFISTKRRRINCENICRSSRSWSQEFPYPSPVKSESCLR